MFNLGSYVADGGYIISSTDMNGNPIAAGPVLNQCALSNDPATCAASQMGGSFINMGDGSSNALIPGFGVSQFGLNNLPCLMARNVDGTCPALSSYMWLALVVIGGVVVYKMVRR